MAAASEGLSYAFNHIFSLNRRVSRSSGHNYYSYREAEEEDSIFNKYIKISIDNNHIEFPIWIKGNIEERLEFDIDHSEMLINDPLKEIIIPIYGCWDLGTIKTADSMLKKFFETMGRERLRKANNGKGGIYYGSTGIVFDSDLNIIMCIFLTADYDKEKKLWVYKQPILRVDPTVFLDQQEFMHKAIIQKITALSMNTHIINTPATHFAGTITERCKIEVVPFTSYVVTPTKPTPSTCNNEVLNKCLLDNISEIAELII